MTFSVVFNTSIAQLDFDVVVHPQEQTWPGLQSYVWGQSGDYYLLAGGRTDGLHRRQPFASFDPAFNNGQLLVVKPISGEVWTMDLTGWSPTISDQLASSNMEFVQMGNLLVVAGGYGYSSSSNSKVTFPSLLVIEIEETINAVINATDASTFIHQIDDEEMAVCGGHLETLNGKLVLVGGHRFDGNYNPMGNPTYSQTYTNVIRSFTVELNEGQIEIGDFASFTNVDLLHRRDYNLLPSIGTNSSSELILFSGVFQPTMDLPYLDCVQISSEETAEVIPSFSQFLNQYHTASIAVNQAASNTMSYIFFGGISQYYYDDAGFLVNDINVPFTKNISAVMRNGNNEWSEYLVSNMPTYLGASAEFLPVANDEMWNNGILNYDALEGDSTLVGYVYGGIESSAANVFWINTGTESWASTRVFEVYIKSQTTNAVEIFSSSDPLQLQVYPNPSASEIRIEFELQIAAKVELQWSDASGRVVDQIELGTLSSGIQNIAFNIPTNWASGRYICTLTSNGESKSIHVMIEK